MEFTPELDLRGGRPCWLDPAADVLPCDALPERTGVAIIGAGVMGGMIGARLAQAGHDVVLLDRRTPASGSTAASTALVMWAADLPLTHLASRIGAAAAARAWRRVHAAIRGLDDQMARQGQPGGWQGKPELYLAGTLLDPAALADEAEARQRIGLPSTFLPAGSVADRFGLPARAALLSGDTFGVDPIALTHDLLRRAREAGAALCFPADVTGLEHGRDDVVLRLRDGRHVAARQVILATGYEAARWFLPERFRLGSSFAIATAPGTARAWREDALIWEASDPYLYARTTAEGRIIVGGLDEDGADAAARDARIGEKRGLLELLGAELIGRDRLEADCAWAACFGDSPDGLPAIGPARNGDRVWLASGFGGNGITFAALAAELLQAALEGAPDADAACFDPYRD